MKITGTRSYILVEFDYRTVKIAGELTVGAIFYAYSGSINNWQPPYENSKITEEEKSEIISDVLKQNNTDFKIVFEE
jgi:hypothetical protein